MMRQYGKFTRRTAYSLCSQYTTTCSRAFSSPPGDEYDDFPAAPTAESSSESSPSYRGPPRESTCAPVLSTTDADKNRFGSCYFWYEKKNYGFIKDDEDGKESFVHHNHLHIQRGRFRALKPGERVKYSRKFHGGKLEAVDVTAPDGGLLLGKPMPSISEGIGRGGTHRYKQSFRGRGRTKGDRMWALTEF